MTIYIFVLRILNIILYSFFFLILLVIVRNVFPVVVIFSIILGFLIVTPSFIAISI
jgi:hypothetical protein